MTDAARGDAARPSSRGALPPPARLSPVEDRVASERGPEDGPRAEEREPSGEAGGALVLTSAQRVPGRRPGAAPPLVLRAPVARSRPDPRPAPSRAGGDAALRALVAEAVRAELGAAIERELAGAVRELVREEIRRALAEHGADAGP